MTTRREKIIAGTLVFFAGVALILGFFQIQKTLRASLLFDAPKKVTASTERSGTFSVDLTKDTDRDGLLDADELNRYGTSPYLADSDSDGKDDGSEIEKGTDPNCPEGKQCGLFSVEETRAQRQPQMLTDILDQGSTIPPSTRGETTAPSTGAGSVAELRNALKGAGVPQEQIDQIDDATLLRMYQETEASTRNDERTPPPLTQAITPTSETTPPVKLTGAEIRVLLKAQGMADEELTQITDAQLEALFQEGVKKKFQQ